MLVDNGVHKRTSRANALARGLGVVGSAIASISSGCGTGGLGPSDAEVPAEASAEVSADASSLDAVFVDSEPAADGSDDSVGCSGAFHQSELLFVDPGQNLTSLSPAGDELEIAYVEEDAASGERRIVTRRRSSRAANFESPAAVPEVAGVCGQDRPTIDLSEDGLRLYISCNPPGGVPGPLRVANRPSRDEHFSLLPTPIGVVASSVALEADELVAYAAATDSTGQPLVYTRMSNDDPFGDGVPLPDVPGPFYTPDPTHDGLQLFGAAPGDSGRNRLVVSRRSSHAAPFGVPDAIGLPVPGVDETDGSPAISADCRTLYFVRVARDTDAGGFIWTARVAHR